MIVETKLIFRQYLGLMFLLTYKKPMVIFLTLLGFVFLNFSILYFLGVSIPFDNPPYLQFAMGLGIIFVFPFTIFWSAKRNFNTNERLKEKITYEFTADQIKIVGETFNSEFTWDKTYKVLELKNWILIFHDRMIANILPKALFQNNLNEFKDFVKKKPMVKNNFSPVKKFLGILIISLPTLPFLLFGIIYFTSQAEPEEYLIPYNYEGEVIVFFNQKNGVPLKYIDGKRIYEIPNDGILFTQAKWNSGFKNQKFFYTLNGRKISIDEEKATDRNLEENTDSNLVSIIDIGPYFYDIEKGKNLFKANEFIVAKRKNFSLYSTETIMDSIIEVRFN